jgi:hypothetical protein
MILAYGSSFHSSQATFTFVHGLFGTVRELEYLGFRVIAFLDAALREYTRDGTRRMEMRIKETLEL